MNFLKKLGSVALKIVGIWTGFQPLVSQTVAGNTTGVKVVGEITQAFGVIDTAEKMFTAAYGPSTKLPSEKLAAARPFLAQLIQQTDMLSGKKPKDEALFTTGVDEFAGAMVKILNSYGE